MHSVVEHLASDPKLVVLVVQALVFEFDIVQVACIVQVAFGVNIQVVNTYQQNLDCKRLDYLDLGLEQHIYFEVVDYMLLLDSLLEFDKSY
jgi:hypothetical protein